VVVLIALAVATGILIYVVDADPVQLMVGSLLMTASLMIDVPAMSGNRVYLGIAAAAAVPVAVSDAGLAAAIYTTALLTAWLLYLVFGLVDRVWLNSEYLAEVIAILGFGGTYHLVSTLFHVPGFHFVERFPQEGYVAIVCVIVGGVVYHVLRASTRSLVGLERADFSPR